MEGGTYIMDLQSHPQRKEQVIAQKASKDFLLFNMDDGNYYSLNDVGCRIWQLCDGSHSVAQIIDTLSAEYDVSGDVLSQDVIEVLESFSSGSLIGETIPAESIANSQAATERTGRHSL